MMDDSSKEKKGNLEEALYEKSVVCLVGGDGYLWGVQIC